MSTPRATRRTALLAGGGALAALAGCGGEEKTGPTPAARARIAASLGEHEWLAQALVVEHAQLAAYTAVAASDLFDGALRKELASYARIEREHVDALEHAYRRQGGRPPTVRTGTVPLADRQSALRFCESLEVTATGMWTWFAQRAVAFDVRTATVSIMGVEARQINGLRAARGAAVTAAAPPPVSVSAAAARVHDFASVVAP